MADGLILVDDEDRELGSLDKEACHNGIGVKHRAFSVFLFDERGRLLLQQRAREKRLWGGYWSNTCCSHPRVGEDTEDAATRRLVEELGIRVFGLEHLFGFSYQAAFGDLGSENEYCHVYFGRYIGEVVPNPDEVSAVIAEDVTELTLRLEAKPGQFTPWFQEEWRQVLSQHQSTLTRFTTISSE